MELEAVVRAGHLERHPGALLRMSDELLIDAHRCTVENRSRGDPSIAGSHVLKYAHEDPAHLFRTVSLEDDPFSLSADARALHRGHDPERHHQNRHRSGYSNAGPVPPDEFARVIETALGLSEDR